MNTADKFINKLAILFIILIGLFFSSITQAGMVLQSVGGGASGQSFSDDFTYSNGELASVSSNAWTQLGGAVFNALSNTADLLNQSVYTYQTTQLDTNDGYMCLKYVADSNGFAGMYFRSQDSASTYAYAVRYEVSNTQFVWRYCGGADHSNDADSCTSIGSAWSNTLNDGDFFCIEWQGQGDSVTVDIWDMGTSVPARGSWGSPDNTWSDDPTTAGCESPPNTGKYVGLYSGSGTDVRFDDMTAGDQ